MHGYIIVKHGAIFRGLLIIMQKSQERSSVSVSQDTRERLMALKYELSYRSIEEMIVSEILLRHEK